MSRGSQPDHGHRCGCTREAVNPTCLASRASRIERIEAHLLRKIVGALIIGFACGSAASAIHPGLGIAGCVVLSAIVTLHAVIRG